MEYDNNMRGTLFHEKDKKNANSPDYTGGVEIDGVKLRLAGWIKTSKSGKRFLSLALSYPKDDEDGDRLCKISRVELEAAKRKAQAVAAEHGETVGDVDDIPF